MGGRFMRILVFFDVPMETLNEQKEYRNFRNHLIKHGFLMVQKSVYSKIVLNPVSMELTKEFVRNHLPTFGTIQMLCITEKQFASIEYLLGKKISDVVDSEKRVVEI